MSSLWPALIGLAALTPLALWARRRSGPRTMTLVLAVGYVVWAAASWSTYGPRYSERMRFFDSREQLLGELSYGEAPLLPRLRYRVGSRLSGLLALALPFAALGGVAGLLGRRGNASALRRKLVLLAALAASLGTATLVPLAFRLLRCPLAGICL